MRTIGRTAAGVAASAAGTLLAWSRLGVNHAVPLPPPLDGAQFDVDDGAGGSVAVYHQDSGSGSPVLLVHSVNAAASAYEMKPLFDHLTSRRPVYALELPGYGASTRGDREYTPQLMADAITNVLSEVDSACHVVALSLSSEFAARAAIRRPDQLASLAIISPTGFGAKSGARQNGGRLLRTRLWSQAIFDLIASRRSIEFFLSRSFTGPVDDGFVDYAYRTSHQPGARFAPLAFLSGEMFSRDATELLYRHVTVPSLVVYDQDPFTGFVRLPEFLSDEADHWDAVRIPGTAGLPHWEQLPATAAALESYWQAHDRAASANAER